MIIRALRNDDSQERLRLRCALWPEEDRDDLALGEVSYGKTAQAPGGSAVFVAERPAGGLCGLIEVGMRDVAEGASTSPVAYLEGWYVDPDMRRTGVGRALVARAEEWARERGCTEIGSDTEVDNTLSQRAHAALGYAESERLVVFHKRL